MRASTQFGIVTGSAGCDEVPKSGCEYNPPDAPWGPSAGRTARSPKWREIKPGSHTIST